MSHTGRVTRTTISRRGLLRYAGVTTGAILVASCAPPQTSPAGSPAATAGSPVPAAPKTLTISASGEVSNLDPARSNDFVSSLAHNLVYDRLVTVDENQKPIPAVAASWQVSSDGLVYTFKLRSGIKFHDGSQLTSADVKFSLDRIIDPKNSSPKATYLNTVKTVEAVDPSTVKVTLKAPYAAFIYSVRQHVLPKDAYEKAGGDFSQTAIGSGPFRFTEWVKNQRMVFERVDDYWQAKPNISKVISRPTPDRAVAASTLLAGDVDVIDRVNAAAFAQLQAASDKAQIIAVPAATYHFIGFAQMGTMAPFNDKRFRQAVYHSFDVDGVIKALFPQPERGVRAYACLPAGGYWPGGDYEGAKALALKMDTSKAKQLFDELIKDGLMPQDYTIKIVINQDADRQRIAEQMIAGLKAAGRNAELTVMEVGAYVARLTNLPRQPESFIYMLKSPPVAPDPDAALGWFFISSGQHAKYLGLPADSPLDQDLKKAQTSTDANERITIYNRTMKQVIGDVYHIPLNFENLVVGASKRVQGLKPAPDGNDWNMVTSFTNVDIN